MISLAISYIVGVVFFAWINGRMTDGDREATSADVLIPLLWPIFLVGLIAYATKRQP